MKSVDSVSDSEEWGDARGESASWLERARIKNRTTHELICWLLYALVVITPAIYSTAFESAFTLPKLTFMRLVTLAIVGIWAVQALVQKKIYYRKSPLNKWLLGYGAVLVATTVFSHYFWVSLFGEQGRFLGLLTWMNLLFLCGVALTFFQSKKEIRRYVVVSVWTAVALAVYGILQFKGLVGAEGWTFDPTLRVFGTMGHSNHFGGYLAFHVLLLLGLFATEKRRGFSVGYAIASLPMFAAILATASRAAFFSLVIAMGVFGVGMLWFHREWVRKSRRKIGGALAGMLVLLLIFQGPLITRLQHLSLTQRTLGTIEFIQSGNVPDRVSWWFSALAMVQEHPVLGYGLVFECGGYTGGGGIDFLSWFDRVLVGVGDSNDSQQRKSFVCENYRAVFFRGGFDLFHSGDDEFWCGGNTAATLSHGGCFGGVVSHHLGFPFAKRSVWSD
ncbi:MAG: hypothetical protein UW70_C0013G0015 [Candidatus Peregrinibacteria bacterium GW2011_GWA2_44_7]|nr:MAG: hypothetical protein UW70_C0013G0015 [Candidatus Peregrinibacteria bacterium GW2011_GWA2_44_7]